MTSIEWTDATWNPVTGCSKVSAGCKNCYAEGVAHRFWGTQYEPTVVDVDGAKVERPRRFTDVRTHADRLDEPLRWRKPRRVFVNSMSDLFHEHVPDEFIDRVFAAMACAPLHTFQVLTKRPARMREFVASRTTEACLMAADEGRARGTQADEPYLSWWARALLGSMANGVSKRPWPLPNVWLGVSVEDQRAADERIPLLLETPAAVRFLSCEPLLGPVDIRIAAFNGADSIQSLEGIDWVIVGGESGPGARPCDQAWVRSIVGQCRVAGVPAFVKQLGARPTMGGDHRMSVSLNDDHPDVKLLRRMRDSKGGDPSEWPEELRVREFPVGNTQGG